MPFGLQPIHLIIIAVVALIIFGPSRLPELGRSIGRMITEFRRGAQEMTDGLREEISRPDVKPAPGAPVSDATGTASVPYTPVIQSPAAPDSIPTQSNAGEPAPDLSQAGNGNFCIQCGAANLPEARFCNKCGASLPA